MNVKQLIEALQKLPADAVVLLEGDVGYSAIGEIELQKSDTRGLPDEVILRPDASE